MSKASDTYAKLFADFNRIEREMREHPQDGQQAELMTAARAIVRFEHEHEIPRLKALITDHGAAVAAIEGAKERLARLERSIAGQESYIESRFAEHDTTADAIDLLAWQLSTRLGVRAIERLTAKAVELEGDLKAFVRDRKGISDCLLVEQEHGWDKVTRESFSWLYREIEETARAERMAA